MQTLLLVSRTACFSFVRQSEALTTRAKVLARRTPTTSSLCGHQLVDKRQHRGWSPTAAYFSTTAPTTPASDDDGKVKTGQTIGGQRPAVVLVGWLMCNPRHLQKVEKWYQDQGLDTIAFTPPPQSTFVPKLSVAFAQSYLRRADRAWGLTANPRPLFFHVFSGQGSIIFLHMKRRMRLKSKFKDIAACHAGSIYDSPPYPVNRESSKRGLASVTYSNPISRYLIYYPFAVVLDIVQLFLFRGLAKKIEDNYRLELDEEERVPQIFFTSRDDDICPPFELEKLVENKQKRGGDSRWVCWDKSHHVSHFLKNNEEYTAQLKSFLDDATGKWDHRNQK